jgi:hypothetical protein
MKNMAPFKKEEILREKVLGFLKKNPKGLTTTEIQKSTKISRKTLEKHLQLLVYENEIYMKQFGPTRVYYPNHRLHYIDFEKLNISNRTYWFDIMQNEFGEFLIIQEKRKCDGKFFTKGSILIPLEKIKVFSNSLNKILKNNKLKILPKSL